MRTMFGKEALHLALRHDWGILDQNYLERRETGIWPIPLDDHTASLISEEALATVLEHPAKDHDRPVLPFPFTLSQFLEFARLVGLQALWTLDPWESEEASGGKREKVVIDG